MKAWLPYPHPSLHPLARLRSWHSLLAAILVGVLAALFSLTAKWEIRLLTAWLWWAARTRKAPSRASRAGR